MSALIGVQAAGGILNSRVKRALDIALASTGVALAAPIMGYVWCRIKRAGDGPVLYRGMRAGRDGRPFEMYKFRTMVAGADQVGGSSTADDDPRITVLGRRLRRYKLDELPQLINVLKGDMSLVGPRPQVMDEVAGYTDEERQLLWVRPGITDWASLRFKNEGEILKGHPDPDRAYAKLIRPEKIGLGLEYVRRATVRDDLKILWQTAKLPLSSAREKDFTTVTETWGSPASPEQLSMAYFRYRMAGALAPGGRVLEVGCGTGMGLAYLAKKAAEAVGCDVDKRILAAARAHLPAVELVEASVGALPFADDSFDAVLMLEMLYYVPDQDHAVADCVRILRPGAALMVCVPNRDRPAFNPSPYNTGYPNAPELATLLRRHGLETTVYGAFPVTPATERDRRLDLIRKAAVRSHLVPRSMRAKALVKRALYGRLPRLGAIVDGMAEIPDAVDLVADRPESAFKNLYAIGRKPGGAE